jgi:hypothetical protein
MYGIHLLYGLIFLDANAEPLLHTSRRGCIHRKKKGQIQMQFNFEKRQDRAGQGRAAL